MNQTEKDNILEVSHLKKYFPIKGGTFGGVTGNVNHGSGGRVRVRQVHHGADDSASH